MNNDTKKKNTKNNKDKKISYSILKETNERIEKSLKGLDSDTIALEVLKELDDETKFRYYSSPMVPCSFADTYGIGMYIRNKYLWGNPNCEGHPDDISSGIIYKVWKLIKEQKIPESKFSMPKVLNEIGEFVDIPYEIYEKIGYINWALKDKDYKIEIKNNKLLVSRHVSLDGVVEDGIKLDDIILDTASIKEYDTQMDAEIQNLIYKYENKFNKKFKDDYIDNDKKRLVKRLKDSINRNFDEFNYLDF